MVPESFNEWYKCITEKCKINLDKNFAQKRIQALTDEDSSERKKFTELYGEDHLENIIHWYRQVL